MSNSALKRLLSVFRRKDEEPGGSEPGQSAPAHATDSSLEQVLIRLQQLVEERSFVDVRFPGKASNTYQSLIIKVDPLERYVLIDELFPAHGSLFVSPGDEVEVTSMRKGIPVKFSSWVKSVSLDEADGFPAYRLALPEAVEAKQRRTFFRVHVDTDAGVKLKIRGPDRERLLCTVQNLSFGGVGFTCQGNLTEALRANNQLGNSVLSIPGVPDISCDLEARSFEFRRKPYRHTLVGSRFVALSGSAEKQLEQYLTLLQRQQRRESSRD
ncbi:MAG: flagellar brake protein [Gammaproteobacteria bacterium]